eukprot:CAMPEP_0183710982 /NCGR_PEP_ID=MMETSP0737-20130205/6586_1 /TAXON_ID=385413 /ORGANISM="Thalassiosira miniscula, Strain CCMP1093" /LENGTH=413 /DNA_ID=CAMNT_0025939373 /DNA_START=12 /DNA_END=1253 /DNA_ORIENTATION=-
MATISTDPRFKLARSLLTAGDDDSHRYESAIEIFATLLDLSRERDGETSLNAALCQYEYGNALFRAAVRKKEMLEDAAAAAANEKKEGSKSPRDDEDKKPAARVTNADNAESRRREIAAAAAMKRSAAAVSGDGGTSSSGERKRPKTGVASLDDKQGDDKEVQQNDKLATNDNSEANANDDDDNDDVKLALDMMETSIAIFISHTTKSDGNGAETENDVEWASGQLPRILVCIGDLHSFREHYGNAVDAYCRALRYREEAWDGRKKAKCNGSSSSDEKVELMTVEDLTCQRQLIETCVLIAEALLACPEGEDVVCDLDDNNDDEEERAKVSSSGAAAAAAQPKKSNVKVLVPSKERKNFIQSYYEMAREGLEELLYRMGKMKGANIDIGDEKRDIGYCVMMVVGIGNAMEAEK